MVILIAVIFDPRYKIDYVEWMLTEIYEEKKAKSIALKLRESFNALFEEYRGSSSSESNKEEVSSSTKDENVSFAQKKIEYLRTNIRNKNVRKREN